MTAPLTLETAGLLAHLRDWLDHYPEDIFAPPPTFTDPRERLLSTVVAAAMGRHVLTRLIADIEEGHPRLMERNTPSKCRLIKRLREPTPNSGPRVDVEALRRLADELEAPGTHSDAHAIRKAIGDTPSSPAPSTSRVAADARMPERRREPPTHAPAPSSGALQIDCIAPTPGSAARDAWVHHDRLKAEGWRCLVGPVQDENEPHGPRVRVTATRQPEPSGEPSSRDPLPGSWVAQRDGAKRWVLDTPSSPTAEPVPPPGWEIGDHYITPDGEGGVVVEVSSDGISGYDHGFVYEYGPVDACCSPIADLRKDDGADARSLALVVQQRDATLDKLDKLTRALESILANEEAAADPAKTCGPRRIEAATRARRLRAALDAAEGLDTTKDKRCDGNHAQGNCPAEECIRRDTSIVPL